VADIAAKVSTDSDQEAIVRRLGARPLVMVGMMGAGKSSIGKRLASRFGLSFADADAEIELAANATISEIFEQHGETYFRDGERRVIQRLLGQGCRVIAAGGGAFMQDETRAAIQAHAISIWLQADLNVLLARVRRRANRPLLEKGDPGKILEGLMRERGPVYALADIHVRSRDVAHEVVIDDIIAALTAHLGQEDPSRGKSIP